MHTSFNLALSKWSRAPVGSLLHRRARLLKRWLPRVRLVVTVAILATFTLALGRLSLSTFFAQF